MDMSSDFLHSKPRYFVSTLHLPNVGKFGREAQATFLYDKVRLSVDAGRTNAYLPYSPEVELQALLGIVMEEVGGPSGMFCGATQILIVYVGFLQDLGAC